MKRIGWLTVTLGLGLALLTRPTFAGSDDDPPPELTTARLWLAEAARIVLANGLRLLGVTAPERM